MSKPNKENATNLISVFCQILSACGFCSYPRDVLPIIDTYGRGGRLNGLMALDGSKINPSFS
jgi:hypothetical protein